MSVWNCGRFGLVRLTGLFIARIIYHDHRSMSGLKAHVVFCGFTCFFNGTQSFLHEPYSIIYHLRKDHRSLSFTLISIYFSVLSVFVLHLILIDDMFTSLMIYIVSNDKKKKSLCRNGVLYFHGKIISFLSYSYHHRLYRRKKNRA